MDFMQASNYLQCWSASDFMNPNDMDQNDSAHAVTFAFKVNTHMQLSGLSRLLLDFILPAFVILSS